MTYSTSNINEIFTIVLTLKVSLFLHVPSLSVYRALSFRCTFIFQFCFNFGKQENKTKQKLNRCYIIIISTIYVRMQVNKIWFLFSQLFLLFSSENGNVLFVCSFSSTNGLINSIERFSLALLLGRLI